MGVSAASSEKMPHAASRQDSPSTTAAGLAEGPINQEFADPINDLQERKGRKKKKCSKFKSKKCCCSGGCRSCLSLEAPVLPKLLQKKIWQQLATTIRIWRGRATSAEQHQPGR